MNATNELRRLLDEHGIEWWGDDDLGPDHTEWANDNVAFTSLGLLFEDGMLAIETIRAMTPEQVMEETVGRDTCHMMLTKLRLSSAAIDIYECSECGEQVVRYTIMGESKPPKYCSECGRRVVE